MADQKISALTAASDLIGAVIPIVQGGVNKQADAALFAVADVPVGGTTGQVLKKASGTDFDTEWAAAREVLTANRTLYVSTTGSDSNPGTIGAPFLTPQKAFDVVAGLDCSIYNVTIQLGDGTYSGNPNWRGHIGSGIVTLLGNTASVGNVIMSMTSNAALVLTTGARLTISGIEFRTTTSGSGIFMNAQSVLTFGAGIRFGACADSHIDNRDGIINNASQNYEITGSAVSHISMIGGKLAYSNFTLTLTGTPAWSGAFLSGSLLSGFTMFSVTMSGSATGVRYAITTNTVINTFGAGTSSTYFPGNANGTTATGAQQA